MSNNNSDKDKENKEEKQYNNIVKDIIDQGEKRDDRTGVGTLTVFGRMMRFDCRKSFALITGKKMFFRGIKGELLWMISGSTDSNKLTEQGIHIWDINGSREFLDKCNFHKREQGDLGPVYGFQFRHSGAKYIDHKTDYTGQGKDQLKECIDMIKNNPNSRRICMTAWNPSDIDKMVLPPCHCFIQFHVVGEYLSLSLYQRSCDVGLGVPFNISQYCLLLYLVAWVTDKKPKEFIYHLGDVHIYNNHVEGLKTQIQRDPLTFPTLHIKPDTPKDIDKITADHIELKDYQSHPTIKLSMAM